MLAWCDNLYSGDFNEASLAICKVLEQNLHLHGLSENSLFCIFMISTTFCWCHNHCFPKHSEDRNDRDQIKHMLALILAIDVWWSWPLISLNISPPPLQKSPWEHLIISTFKVPSTHRGKKFDPEAQTVCIGYQRWHKQVLWMLTCALPGIKFENPC